MGKEKAVYPENIGKPVAFCYNSGEWSNKAPFCVKAGTKSSHTKFKVTVLQTNIHVCTHFLL
jgi:hypothetical protein